MKGNAKCTNCGGFVGWLGITAIHRQCRHSIQHTWLFNRLQQKLWYRNIVCLLLVLSYSELFVESRQFCAIWVLQRSLASENYSPWAIVQHCLRDPTFSHFNRTPTCDRQLHCYGIYRARKVSRGKNWHLYVWLRTSYKTREPTCMIFFTHHCFFLNTSVNSKLIKFITKWRHL